MQRLYLKITNNRKIEKGELFWAFGVEMQELP